MKKLYGLAFVLVFTYYANAQSSTQIGPVAGSSTQGIHQIIGSPIGSSQATSATVSTYAIVTANSITTGILREVHELVGYPNPTSDRIHLKSKVRLTSPTLYVWDAQGKLLHQKSFSGNHDEWDISLDPYPSGFIILQIIDTTTNHYIKVLKQ